MTQNTFKFLFLLLIVGTVLFASCRGEEEQILPPVITPLEPVVPENDSTVTEGDPNIVGNDRIKGFFLLNEANMGSNKASIDYFDRKTGKYCQNIYPYLNPNIAHELGDVGNDIQIYGSKLYAVINVSGYVEVMDVNTARHVNSLTIPNCRYITFDKGYAYVSSYNGPVKIEPDAPLGCVVKIDTTTMREVGRVTVGYQPEEMVIRDNKLYVANSGGYRVPNYDNTVSAIDLDRFEEIKKITVGINLHRLELDSDGNIYASSRGDYKTISSNTYIIGKNDLVSKVMNLPCSEMTAMGDSIYMYSVEWSHITQKNTITYAIVNTKTQTVVSRNFITDGTDKQIVVPYGLAIHPETWDIYITDARDYVSPGVLYCFDRNGKRKWSVVTGDIPSSMVFTKKRLTSLVLD